jgi:hypothetical protein
VLPTKPRNGISAVASLSLHFARSTNIESRFLRLAPKR